MLAADAGLDAHEARDVVNGNAYSDEVDADIKEARLLGVSGVPFFVIDDRYGVSGAQPVDVFRQVLAHARANRVTAS
jgi:predicted DsbA family dithiol-disulfide isomerase